MCQRLAAEKTNDAPNTFRFSLPAGRRARRFPGRRSVPSRPVSDPATGERYHIEVSGGFWNPTPDLTISSEALGILGTDIDVVKDLGIAKARFKELHVVLRPATKHKFRLSYIPISYSAESTLKRDIVFNGLKFSVGIPVNSTLDWKAYRFGYEYDFLYRDRWFVGAILEAKSTDVEATLKSPIDSEWARARAPIPALGGIARVYVVPNISITGEFSGFKLPKSVDKDKKYDGKYYELDIYGTVNFTNNFGVQMGYRKFDLSYQVKTDSGALKMSGLYLSAVARY